MTLGADMKEVIMDVGLSSTIIRDTGNITGQYIKIKTNAQVTKPFIREFFLEAWFPNDTQIVAGDYVQLPDARVFMIMNKTPKIFEGSIYRYEAVLYKCNVAAASILRPSVANHVTSWGVVKSNVNALMTESFFQNEYDVDEGIGGLSLKSQDLYIPSSLNLSINDRFKISTNEYYQVEVVRKRRFDAVDLITLGEDNRG